MVSPHPGYLSAGIPQLREGSTLCPNTADKAQSAQNLDRNWKGPV